MSLLFDQLRIERLTDEIKETYKQSETSQRLATIPGVEMLSATIIAATTSDVDNLDCGRRPATCDSPSTVAAYPCAEGRLA